MLWQELKPGPNDPLSELPSVLTGNAIIFRQSIEKHSYWTDSSGVSAGITRLSDGSFGPGAARAFFDTQSNLSTTLSATKPLTGRLYITSDTKRLYTFSSSGATVWLGGKNTMVYLGGSTATIQSNTRVLTQIGSVSTIPGSSTVTFPTAYSVAPVVQLMPMSSQTTYMTTANANVVATDHFSLSLKTVFGATETTTVMWRSHGTVAL